MAHPDHATAPALRVSAPTAPPAPAALRTDVAAFVGRVKRDKPSDPLPDPAAVESPEAFAKAFAEAPDSRLGPAVRAFFRNGGRRCWVIPADPPFIDDRLEFVGAPSLVREAALMDAPTDPLCTWPANRPPTGVHAVLALEEVTLLVVPDAFPPRPTPASVPADSGAPSGTTPTARATLGASFGPYKVPDPAALALNVTRTARSEPPRDWVELSWTWQRNSSDPSTASDDTAARDGAKFVVVRSPNGAFPANETTTVYRGTATSVSVGTEPAYYRVRAETPALTGGWAVPPPQSVPAPPAVTLKEDPVATQVAAVKVCAARGDVFAVLAPPESWPKISDDEWLQLQTPVTADPVPKGDWIGLLRKSTTWPGGDGSSALQTHAAFWGPWVLVRDSERPAVRPEVPEAAPAEPEPDAYPADGAVCGLLARRAIERGPWASVLNMPVAGALALGPAPYGPGELVPLFAAEPESASRAAVKKLQDGGINVLARTTRGFVPVGERTPAASSPFAEAQSDIVPVRRFMALLRRELGRVGLGLAFAPNGPALERRAVRAVESVLEVLLRRGALVGPDARSSFQVTARSGAPGSPVESQLVVEVRVRPAVPLRLLTIRLVRSGEDAFTLAEVS